MMDFLRILGYCLIALIGAGFLLFMVSCWMSADHETKVRQLQERHYNESAKENEQAIRLLSMARGYPFGSPEQTAIMQEYKCVDAANQKRWDARVQEIVK